MRRICHIRSDSRIVAAYLTKGGLEGFNVSIDDAWLGHSLSVCFQLTGEPVRVPKPSLVRVDPTTGETAQQDRSTVQGVLGQLLHQLM